MDRPSADEVRRAARAAALGLMLGALLVILARTPHAARANTAGRS